MSPHTAELVASVSGRSSSTWQARLSGHGRITNAAGALRTGLCRAYVEDVKIPKRHAALSTPFMMAELAWASWETIARRSLMMAQNTCSMAEYNRMVAEKTAAMLDISRVLMSPGVSTEALLHPLHSRATANAKRLRRG